jgi:hypothetical protein
MSTPELYQTYEHSQPWVVYTYPRTDAEADRLGEALIVMQCAVCGEREEWRAPLPSAEECARIPADHKPQARIDFLVKHNHRPLPHALTWALPLLNVAAHNETLDVLEQVARSAAAGTPGEQR